MDSFRSLPVKSGNRAPTTRAPASYAASPYRSINVSLPTAPSATVLTPPVSAKDPLVAALARATVSVPLKQRASESSPIPTLPCPLAYFPLGTSSFFHAGDDAQELVHRIERALREVAGGEVDVVQTQGECSVSCRVDAKDDARCCTLAVNLFDVSAEKDAPGKFLIEGARMSGCPVLFGHVTRNFLQGLGKTHPVPESMLQHCTKQRRPFQAPALPENFLKEDSVEDAEIATYLDNTATMALGRGAETRVMAVKSLADACKDSKCASLFGKNGVARISCLLTDKDPAVRLAALRISQRVENAS